ncbi:MAG: Hsp20/alpha crystallin family protein [Terriglobales bacterium]
MTTLLNLDFPFSALDGLLACSRQDAAGSEWTPRTAIHEDEHSITLELDVPGVQPQEVELQVEPGQLTIRGERKPQAALEHYRRVEPSFGAFARTFALPDSVDRDAISAKLEAGVLRVTLPQRAEAKPRRIEVNAAA